MMVSKDSLIKAADGDLVKVKSREKRVFSVFPHHFKHYPRDYMLKDFWFPHEVFRLTKNPLFLNNPTSPWLDTLYSPKHIRM